MSYGIGNHMVMHKATLTTLGIICFLRTGRRHNASGVCECVAFQSDALTAAVAFQCAGTNQGTLSENCPVYPCMTPGCSLVTLIAHAAVGAGIQRIAALGACGRNDHMLIVVDMVFPNYPAAGAHRIGDAFVASRVCGGYVLIMVAQGGQDLHGFVTAGTGFPVFAVLRTGWVCLGRHHGMARGFRLRIGIAVATITGVGGVAAFRTGGRGHHCGIVVDMVVVGGDDLLGPHTVGIVLEGHRHIVGFPADVLAVHRHEFPAMLPCIGPGPVIQGVADFVVGYGCAVVIGEQVAPLAVAIGIGDGVQHLAKAFLGVGILLAGQDVARVIVGPYPGLPQLLVVLLTTNQLFS